MASRLNWVRSYDERKRVVAYLATVQRATKVDVAKAANVNEGRALSLLCSSPWLVERCPGTHQRHFAEYRLRDDVASGTLVSMSRAQCPEAVVAIAHALHVHGPMTVDSIAKAVARSVADTGVWLSDMATTAQVRDDGGKWRLREDGPWFLVPPRTVRAAVGHLPMANRPASLTPLHRLVQAMASWSDEDCEAAMLAVAQRKKV